MDLPAAILGPLGTLVASCFAVWALATGRVVSRSQYRELRQDRDYWRQLALSGTSLAQKALTIKTEKEAPM